MDDRLEQLLDQLDTPRDERQRIRDAVADQSLARPTDVEPPAPA